MNIISVVLGLFLIDLLSDFLLTKVLKNNVSTWYVLFLQIPKLCLNFLIIQSALGLGLKCLLRLCLNVVALIFITDSFKVVKIFKMILLKLILEFSIFGFSVFVIFWMCGILEQGFKVYLNDDMKLLVLMIVLFYVILIFTLIRFLEENKKIESFLANVSLILSGRHIRFYALMDSGNSLIDPLTKKPVLLISKKSLLKFLSEKEIELLIQKNRTLKCQTISETKINIPLISHKKVWIKFNGSEKECCCMLGIVENKFEKGKYDCLLPRVIV